MTPTHIAIVTDAWLPQVNGVVRTLQRTQQELEAMGHTVTVISAQNARTIPCPTYPEIELALRPFHVVRTAIETARQQAAESNMPFALHISTEGPLGFAARRWARKRRHPFTTAYHTRFPEYVHARMKVGLEVSYRFLRWFHGPAQATMAPSASIVSELKNRGFTNPVLWSRGVDLEKFTFPQQKPNLGHATPVAICTGRVAVEKNLPAFLNMPWPGSKIVVGDGPDRTKLEAQFPDVVFTGRLSDEEMVHMLHGADVFVFPSRTETFGNVVLESLACGLPVAAYPVPGPMDTISRAPTQVGALSENLADAALAALEADPKACRSWAETFTWTEVTATFFSHLAPVSPKA